MIFSFISKNDSVCIRRGNRTLTRVGEQHFKCCVSTYSTTPTLFYKCNQFSDTFNPMFHDFTILLVDIITDRIKPQLFGDFTSGATTTENVNDCLVRFRSC